VTTLTTEFLGYEPISIDKGKHQVIKQSNKTASNYIKNYYELYGVLKKMSFTGLEEIP
jgi:hypothetical protein